MKPSDQARRLHPLTLIQRLVVSLPGLVFILLPVFRESDSTAWFNLIFAALYAAFVLPWVALYYIRFRYWITSSELIIHSGVITRRRRNIPIERIQNIEIERAPLQRLLGTAKVAVYTAGSDQAEGVLEYVSLDEAREIRSAVRQMQMGILSPSESPLADGEFSTDETTREREKLDTGDAKPLFEMQPRRVFLAGAFHFSLLYFAGIFSILQYIEPDPTIFFSWLLRGPLDPWRATIEASPGAAVAIGIVMAVFLGWMSGALVTVNKYFRFQITLSEAKLHRKNGLMTLAEGTIPLKRIQSLIVRTNPLMQYFGFFKLELQTMGIDLKDSGFQLAAPFARKSELDGFISEIGSMNIPEVWEPVSPITIRRFIFRYSAVLFLLLASLWYFTPQIFPMAWWALGLLPVLVWISIARWKNMGYSLVDNGLAIRKGIFKKHVWLIPLHKSQTFSLSANYFQRRLGLENLYVDTAGASPMVPAELVDIPSASSRYVLEELNARFKAQ